MRKITLLIVSGGLLAAMAAPVNAHRAGHHEYDRVARHAHYSDRRSEMPRWLRRNEAFRKWYRRSRYPHRRGMSWARLHEIYHWERRYARRYHQRYHHDHYIVDRRADRLRRRAH